MGLTKGIQTENDSSDEELLKVLERWRQIANREFRSSLSFSQIPRVSL